MKSIDQDDVCFRGYEQAPQGLPVGDGDQARRANRAWHQGAEREARAQRPLPVRLSEVVSSAAVCAAAAFDGVKRHHYER
jgi:hypothetical protein